MTAKLLSVTQLPSTTYEVMSTLLDWVSDSQLRYTTIDNILKPVDRVATQEFLQEKVFKVVIHTFLEAEKDMLCLFVCWAFYFAYLNIHGQST